MTLQEKARLPLGTFWRDVLVLGLAIRDARVPLYIKGGILLGAGYLLSPIDFLPEFIPFAGFVDDLIIVPLVMRYSFRLIPPDLLQDLRTEADSIHDLGKKIIFITVGVLLAWIAIIVGLTGYLFTRIF